MAAWIKMLFGMELGFGPDDFVMGIPLPLPKRGEPPHFRPMFIAAKRLSGWSWYLAWR